MKLILCPYCSDVRKMTLKKWAICECGKSWGRYVDDINAEIKGATIALALDNNELVKAVPFRVKPPYASEAHFSAWVISDSSETVKRIAK